ncbi:MAG TPA: hypothetical protein VLC09_11175 [Polyangiaceae bacterium]|nr:hypothetical protein [Polyangiaceae bacterium]
MEASKSANGIAIDLTLWPIVRTTPQGRLSDDDWEQMFREFERLWRRGERFMTITDTRFSNNPTSKQRQRIGQWIRDNNDSARHCTIGAITIVESVIVRGALTVIDWLAQPNYPMEYVRTWAQAASCSVRWLEEAELLTPRLREQIDSLPLTP